MPDSLRHGHHRVDAGSGTCLWLVAALRFPFTRCLDLLFKQCDRSLNSLVPEIESLPLGLNRVEIRPQLGKHQPMVVGHFLRPLDRLKWTGRGCEYKTLHHDLPMDLTRRHYDRRRAASRG